MDDETKAAFEAMMKRTNDGFESVIERVRGVDAALRGVEAMLALRNETTRSTNTLLQVLANGIIDHGKRITDLESKP